MNYYVDVIRKYAVFSGRAPRKEYWMFFLCNMIVAVVIAFPIGLLKGFAHIDLTIIVHLYTLALLCPGIAVAMRRLHDTNRSGLWMLLSLIPLVGPIILLVFMASEGTPGDNNFGPNPKAIATTSVMRQW
jgi:uncharacterized membrane protein YhaH (DUF805 family)